MRFLTSVIKYAIGILRSVSGSLDVAEIRSYAWDGVAPLHHRHGWTTLFGDPYGVVVTDASYAIESGWVDVRGLANMEVTIKATGAAADTVGTVQAIFQIAFSPADAPLRMLRDDLAIAVVVNGTTQMVNTEVFDVSQVSYIRVSQINMTTNGNVTVEIITTDASKPIILS